MDVSPKDSGDLGEGLSMSKLASNQFAEKAKAVPVEADNNTGCWQGQVAGAVATAAATIAEVAVGLGGETPHLGQLSSALSQLASLIQVQRLREPNFGSLAEHAAATVLAEASAADAMLRLSRAQEELQRLQASSPWPQMAGKHGSFRPPPGLELAQAQQPSPQRPPQPQQRLWPAVAAVTSRDDDCGHNASGFVTPRSVSRSTSAASLTSSRSTEKTSDGSNLSAQRRS